MTKAAVRGFSENRDSRVSAINVKAAGVVRSRQKTPVRISWYGNLAVRQVWEVWGVRRSPS